MIKNATIYKLAQPLESSADQIEEALHAGIFITCGASQEKSTGWVPPRGEEHGALLESVGGQWILKLMVESKSVPGSVVKRKVDEQCKHIEATTGRKPGKKEKREISEDARMALLPMAFTKQSSVTVWIDPKSGFLVLDSGSQSKADEVMTALVKAVDGLAVQLVNTQTSPAAAMSIWLSTHEAPQGFSVDRECELKAADESKAVVKYGRHALDIAEVAQHIAQGKVPTRVAMTWNDRVSFVLTEGLQLKKVSILDVVITDAAGSGNDISRGNFDADVAITTGELAQLIPALLEAFGGEVQS